MVTGEEGRVVKVPVSGLVEIGVFSVDRQTLTDPCENSVCHRYQSRAFYHWPQESLCVVPGTPAFKLVRSLMSPEMESASAPA